MDSNETYVYKSEVNWSLLTEGLTLSVENQVIFARNMGHFLHRGEAKAIILYLNGKGYRAQIRNANFDSKHPFLRIYRPLEFRLVRIVYAFLVRRLLIAVR